MSNRSITTEEPIGIPFDHLISRNLHDKADNKLYTGFYDFDKLTGGIPKVGLTVLGGRPAMGCTSLALNLARNMSIVFGIPTAYVSSQFNEEELADRIVNPIAKIMGEKIEVDGEELSIYSLLSQRYSPLYLQLITSKSPKDFETYCEQLVERRGVRVIILDTAESMVYFAKFHDYDALGALLHNIAVKLNICIIAVTHLSRTVEDRCGDHRPTLGDLKYGLDARSDMVMLLYRPEYYGFDTDEDGNDTRNMANITILKGKCCEIRMLFYKPCLYFTSTRCNTQEQLLRYALQNPNNSDTLLKDYTEHLKIEDPNFPEIAFDSTTFEAMRKLNPEIVDLNNLFVQPQPESPF